MRNKKILLMAIVLLAVIFQLLLWRPIYLWLKTIPIVIPYWPYLVITIVLSISLPLSFCIGNRKISAVSHFIGEALFNLTTVLAPMIILADISALLISDYSVQIVGNIIAAVFLLITVGGVINAFFIREKDYEVRLEKTCEKLRIALISDIHLGAFSDKNMVRRIVQAVSRTRADIVIIAGDFFDGRFEAVRNSENAAAELKKLSDPVPIYCAEGNHDLFESSPARTDFIKAAGIRWMEDEVINYCGYQILFRKDASNMERKTMRELCSDIKADMPLIAVAHNPSDISELWNAGCDLTLSGHTHGGQTFPGNLIYKLLPAFSYGKKTVAGKTAIVTSGIGFYGIPVRFLVNNEVAVIEVSGKNMDEDIGNKGGVYAAKPSD